MLIDPFSKSQYGHVKLVDTTPMERRDELLSGWRSRAVTRKFYRNPAVNPINKPPVKKVFRGKLRGNIRTTMPVEFPKYDNQGLGFIALKRPKRGPGETITVEMWEEQNRKGRCIKNLHGGKSPHPEDSCEYFTKDELEIARQSDYDKWINDEIKPGFTVKRGPGGFFIEEAVDAPVATVAVPVAAPVQAPVTPKYSIPAFVRSNAPSTFEPEEVFIGDCGGALNGYYNGDYSELDGFFSKIFKPFKKLASKISPIQRKKVQQKKKRTNAYNDLANANRMLAGILTPEARQHWTVMKTDAETRLGMATKKLTKARKTEKIVGAIAATIVTGGAAAGMLGPGAAGFVGTIGKGALTAIKATSSFIGKGIGMIKSGAVSAGKALISGAVSKGLTGAGMPSGVAETVGVEASEIAARTGSLSETEVADMTNAALTAYYARQGNMEAAGNMMTAREESGGGPYTFTDAASETLEEQDADAETNKWLMPALIGGGILIAGFMMKGKKYV